jgi:hypothetical protein
MPKISITSNRRTASKIKDGRVQRSNRHLPTGLQGYVLDREPPGVGCRHVVSKRDVQTFIDIIPDWQHLSQRLERIFLCRHGTDDGSYAFYHREETGAIFLCAWPQDLWMELSTNYYDAHEEILSLLGVSHDRKGDTVMCRFTVAQARAFTLLHVFMHELGHHHDKLRQKHRGSSRGEDYAERFATTQLEHLFPLYVRVFGDPNHAG